MSIEDTLPLPSWLEGLSEYLTNALQTLDHSVQDMGPNCILGPVMLQRREHVVHLIIALLPVQTLKMTVVQHQWVVNCHAGDKKRQC